MGGYGVLFDINNKPGSFITKSMQDQRITYGLTRNSRNNVYVCLKTKLLYADEARRRTDGEWTVKRV